MSEEHPLGDEETMARLGGEFAQLSRALAASDGDGLDPEQVIKIAAMTLPHTDHCALTLLRPGQLPHTLSATDELPARVDAIEHETGEGPCIDAAEGDAVTLSGALEADPRWPAFGPRCVAETGVHSIVSVRLGLAAGDQAAMNFYSRTPDAFGEIDVGMASMFAPFATLAVEQTLRQRDSDNFESALSSSRQIGTAIGILMARQRVDSGGAFELLREASQHLNRKLRDIATEVAQTGELPEYEGGPASGADTDPV